MKVILAVDGSRCSEAAVEEVKSRRWPEGTEIKVLSAVDAPIPDVPDAPMFILYPARMQMMEEERKRMNHVVKTTASKLRESASDLNIEELVMDGPPKQVIVEQAESWPADLVIVGCHGYGNIKRFLLGSVSQAVAVHAPCSVLIIRTKHQ
jgi:nucleotide-binding universal stress UspA family protein